jgi:hypothetical protein
VRMRRRNPWVLARRRLFGWKVRLLTRFSPDDGVDPVPDVDWFGGVRFGHHGTPATRRTGSRAAGCSYLARACDSGRHRGDGAHGTARDPTRANRDPCRGLGERACSEPARMHRVPLPHARDTPGGVRRSSADGCHTAAGSCSVLPNPRSSWQRHCVTAVVHRLWTNVWTVGVRWSGAFGRFHRTTGPGQGARRPPGPQLTHGSRRRTRGPG